MPKFTKTLLFLTLVLAACSPSISSPEIVTPSNPTLTPFSQTNTASTSDMGTPNIGQPPDGNFPTPLVSQQDCGYQWAYNDLPEISEQFDQTIKNLNPESTSHAAAFGENCVASDGQVAKFLAMETDFYVTLPVTDLSNYESFGNWIVQVMQVINSYPPDMLAGPNHGFV